MEGKCGVDNYALRSLPLHERRRLAHFSVLAGEDLLEVADKHGIRPRTLLAWHKHESYKWEDDATTGREPGPGDDYNGEWPDEETEMTRYADHGLHPSRFEDLTFRSTYERFLKVRMLKRNLSWLPWNADTPDSA